MSHINDMNDMKREVKKTANKAKYMAKEVAEDVKDNLDNYTIFEYTLVDGVKDEIVISSSDLEEDNTAYISYIGYSFILSINRLSKFVAKDIFINPPKK